MTQPPYDPRTAAPQHPRGTSRPPSPGGAPAPDDVNGPTTQLTRDQLHPGSAPKAALPADDINGPTTQLTRDQVRPRATPHRQGPSAPRPPASGGPRPPAPPPVVPPAAAWPAPGVPGGGYPAPPATPQKARTTRLALIGGIATVAVLAVGAGFVFMRSSDSASDTSSAGSTTSSASSSTKNPDGVYRVVPQKMLPSESDVQKATMFSLTAAGAVATTASNDVATSPPNCAGINATNSVTSWGPAISDAGQAYQDGTDADFSHFAFVGLAVFKSPADAAASMNRIADSARNCTGTYTVQRDGKTLTWRVDNTKVTDSSARWELTQVDSPAGRWVCTHAYATKGNLAAAASTCGQSANDGPGMLVDQVLAKATK